MTDIEELAETKVLDLEGSEHTLRSLWEGGPTVLLWLRHYG